MSGVDAVGGVRGCDGIKKVSGRTRHLLVETKGLVLRVKVQTTARWDRAAVPLFFKGAVEQFPQLEHVRGDQGDTGTDNAWIEDELGWSVEVVQHPTKRRGECAAAPVGRVERASLWLGHNRRFNKDDAPVGHERGPHLYDDDTPHGASTRHDLTFSHNL